MGGGGSTVQSEYNLSDPVAVLVAGKIRCGKSTVLNNLFGLDFAARLSATPVTQGVVTKRVFKSGRIFSVVDTPGLGGRSETIVEKMVGAVKDSNFVLVYCQPVYPSATMTEIDRAIVRTIQASFGRHVWSKCVLLLTFSDTARRELRADHEYISYLQGHVEDFHHILTSCGAVTRTQLEDYSSGKVVAIPVTNAKDSIEIDNSWIELALVEIMKASLIPRPSKEKSGCYGTVQIGLHSAWSNLKSGDNEDSIVSSLANTCSTESGDNEDSIISSSADTCFTESGDNEDSIISSLAEDVHPHSSFSLADYPPLPKIFNGEKKVLAGFSADNEVSVTYAGESGRLDWEECDLTLLFDESSDHSSEVSKCPVYVSAGESGAFRYPPRVESASKVYHIDCPKQLNTPVTIIIKHNVPKEDIPYLRFITCSEDQPPYEYTVLNEGKFTTTTAEISFKGFFFCALGKLKNLVKGLLSIMERSYAASVYCSIQPTQYNMSVYSWSVYVSAVKNCASFKQSIKKYIKEEYEEDVKLKVNEVVSFVDGEQSITATTSWEPSLKDIHMNACGSPVIKKVDISRYVDATPPLIRYDLQVPLQFEGISLKIKITLRGLQEPKNYLYLHLTVPQLSSPLSAPLPHRSNRLSSELESSSHTGYTFSMKNLRVLHIGTDKELHLIEEMSSQWKEVGDLLGLRISHTRVIQENNPRSVVDCCREVIAEWLDDEKGRYNYPPSWEGLCRLLKDLKLATAAKHIQTTILK